jgi:uncharacterized OsmC-like protein
MATITVTQVAGDQFRIAVRGHELLVDQPQPGGGEAGPTPTELFVTSLAACVGHYAAGYLRRHEQPYEGLRVNCDWRMLAAKVPRVGRIRLEVCPPAPVPDELQAPLRAAIEHCTVHTSLLHPPEVAITVAVPEVSKS